MNAESTTTTAGRPGPGGGACALVLGLGVSGQAAAELLLSEGTAVAVVDRQAGRPLAARARALRRRGASVALGATSLAPWLAGRGGRRPGLCVLSPGVRLDSDWVAAVRAAGVPVLSELELGASRCRCPLLAVTGSKGKSTLVKLCTEALAAAGQRTEPAGNYGPPLSAVAARSASLDWIVVEVSSFQLEAVNRFHPRVAVLLNVLPDHLDRHGDLATYARLKSRLFARMGARDTRIVPDTWQAPAGGRSRPGPWVTFGLSSRADYRFRAGRVVTRAGGRVRAVALSGTRFDNEILGVAAAAAVAAVRGCGVDPACVARAAAQFRPLPHRLQEIAARRGVRFIDDSKATNLAALGAALRMCGGRARLIAGGLLKEGQLDSVKALLAKHAAAVYLIGDAAPRLAEAWSGAVVCRRCRTLGRAVRTAWREAVAGDVVLLAPGCASFDQFRNFEHRGDRFQTLVRALKEEPQ